MKQLCLLRLSAVGDCCNLLPVIRTLQQYLPNTELTWVIGKSEASLLRGTDGIELVEYDKNKRTDTFRQAIASRKFDGLLLMQVALRAGLVSRQIKAPLRVGFDASRSRDGHGFFINQRIAKADPGHVIDGFFGFAEFLGISERIFRWDIPVPDDAIEKLNAMFPASSQPFLVISPCSSQRSRNFRNWSAENYAAVASHAIQKFGLQVVITGTGTDEEHTYARQIQDLVSKAVPNSSMPVPVINLVGKTDLKMLYALLGRAITVIAPDSGPVHMSIAAGTPAIGLYATSNPDRTGPVLGRKWVVNQYPEAVQRFIGRDIETVRWGRRVRHPDAMSLINKEMVTDRLEQLLATPFAQRLEQTESPAEGINDD